MRLFVAVELPREIRKKIAERFTAKLTGSFKAVEEENLHLTLCFVGEKNEEQTRKIVGRLEGMKFEPFEAELSGAGSFGTRAVWVGLTQGAREAAGLAEKICEACGTKDEKFHAHVTIARNKRAGEKEFEETISRLKKEKFREKFLVKGFTLIKSELTEKGPVYAVVSERTFSKSDSGS